MMGIARPPDGLRSLPFLDGAWTHVATRSYGTVIYRVRGPHAYYVKITPPRERDDARFHPVSEAERLSWLGAQGFPVPEVVEVGSDDETMWLVTRAVEGRPASERWSEAERPAVVDLVADVARALHALPVRECPFDRTLAVTLPQARRSAELGRVDLDDLDPGREGWSAQRLLDELDATSLPGAEDIVVCHGDLCLDNIMIEPGTLTLAGILDHGRLGRADRWVDLAIAVREISEEGAGSGYRPHHVDRFLQRYGAELDHRKLHFYRLLDEFV